LRLIRNTGAPSATWKRQRRELREHKRAVAARDHLAELAVSLVVLWLVT